MKFIILGEFLSLKILSQQSGQGKHSCIAKILKILKIKFRKIKTIPVLKLGIIINESFRPLDHIILTKFVKILTYKLTVSYKV